MLGMDAVEDFGDLVLGPCRLVRQNALAAGCSGVPLVLARGKDVPALRTGRVASGDELMALRTFLCRRFTVVMSVVWAYVELVDWAVKPASRRNDVIVHEPK